MSCSLGASRLHHPAPTLFSEGCTGARSWAGWAWHLGFAAGGMRPLRDAPMSSERRWRSPAPTCRWLGAVASLPWNKDGFIPVISV